MKKFIVFAIAVLGFATATLAQEDYKKVRFGAKVDMNVASMGSSDSKIGFGLGMTTEVNFTNRWYMNTGLEYTWKGGETGPVNMTVGYLQIPIRAAFRHDFSEKFGIFVEAGPYLAIALHADMNDKDCIDRMKRFDVGLTTNAGVQFAKKFKVGLGYDYGFMDAMENGGSSKNGNLHIGVAYMF